MALTMGPTLVAATLALAAVAGSAAAVQEQDAAAQFRAEVDATRAQMDADPAAAAETLDRLAAQSADIRRTRTLAEAERPVHVDLFRMRARANQLLLNNQKVEDSFRELLRIDPFYSGALNPRERQLVEGLRAREGGFLEIASLERDARIFINGAPAGVTGDSPARFTLLAGDYEVRLEKDGYDPAITKTTIPISQVVALREFAPTLSVPPLVFVADRDEVEVVANDNPLGRTARIASLRSQLPGDEWASLERAVARGKFDASAASAFIWRQPPVGRPTAFRFRRECAVDLSRTVEITKEMVGALDRSEPLLWLDDLSPLRLPPDRGTLRIVTTPPDAAVSIDDQPVGRSPFQGSVCAGARRVHVRHAIGAEDTTATVTRDRTTVVDIALKPGMAFLGAVEPAGGAFAPSPALTGQVDQALSSVLTTYRLAPHREVPPDAPGWRDASTGELIAAVDQGDASAVGALLRTANERYEAPLLVAAVGRGAAGAPDHAIEILVFWVDHEPPDRMRWLPASKAALTDALAVLDAPADGLDLVFQNSLGLRVADAAFPGAPLVAVMVDPGSPAETAGLRVGDAILAADGAEATAEQLDERVRQKRPGDLVALRVQTSGQPAVRQVSVPIQRRPRRADVFDRRLLGNTLIAKLTAASASAAAADRDLFTFHLALARMRFGEWKAALDLLSTLGNVPVGAGIGPGSVLIFRAQCLEALGDPGKARALYEQAAAILAETFSDDGTSVGAVAKRRLATLGAAAGAPRQP